MSGYNPNYEPPKLSEEEAQLLIKAIEELEREEAEQQVRKRQAEGTRRECA